MQEISKSTKWFFETNNQIDKILARLLNSCKTNQGKRERKDTLPVSRMKQNLLRKQSSESSLA